MGEQTMRTSRPRYRRRVVALAAALAVVAGMTPASASAATPTGTAPTGTAPTGAPAAGQQPTVPDAAGTAAAPSDYIAPTVDATAGGWEPPANGYPEWDNNIPVYQVNSEPAHSTLMPYADLDQALAADRTDSPYRSSLDGTWKF